MGITRNLLLDMVYHNDFVKYARRLGVEVGNNCKILSNPRKFFGTEPWLIRIGNHVEITGNVTLLTHDGSTWVIREEYPDAAVWGTITIKDNVFIGYGSIVMPNVTIGTNCIIGAGSIVTKSIPDNSVAVGIPAKVIGRYDEFKDRIVKKSIPVLHMKQNDQIIFCKNHFHDFFSV